MSAPEINKEISDLSVTSWRYPLAPTMARARTPAGKIHIMGRGWTGGRRGLKSELSRGLISYWQVLISMNQWSDNVSECEWIFDIFPSFISRCAVCPNPSEMSTLGSILRDHEVKSVSNIIIQYTIYFLASYTKKAIPKCIALRSSPWNCTIHPILKSYFTQILIT